MKFLIELLNKIRPKGTRGDASYQYTILVRRNGDIYSASIRELCISHSSINAEDALTGLLKKELEAICVVTNTRGSLPPRIEAQKRRSVYSGCLTDLLVFSVKSLVLSTVIIVTAYSFTLSKLPTLLPMAKERFVQYVSTPHIKEQIHLILDSLGIGICVER